MGIPPAPDGSESCEKALGEYYRNSKENSVIELAGFDEKLKRREEILDQIGQLQREQKQIEH